MWRRLRGTVANGSPPGRRFFVPERGHFLVMTRATLIAISIALIIGGLFLIGFELMWATSIDLKFVLFVIAGGAAVALGSIFLLVEEFL